MVFLATVVATVYLFIVIPKGFFPQQDTGILFGTSEAPQDISFAEMAKLQEQLGAIVQADPDVENVAMAHRRRRRQRRAEQRPHVHHAQAARRARRRTRSRSSRGCGPKLAKVEGRAALPAGGAGRHRRRARRAHAVPVHAAGRQSRRAERLGAEDPGEARQPAGTARRRHRPADRRHDADALSIDRDMASRFGIQPQLIDDTLYDAFGQRQVAQYFTQINTYNVIEEILPQAAGRSRRASTSSTSARRPPARWCR